MNDTSLGGLFGKDYRVLNVILDQPEIEWTLPQVTKATLLPKMSAYRSLERILKEGILTARSDHYRKYYRLKYSYLTRFLRILRNLDSIVIKEVMARFGKDSTFIILFGSRAMGTDEPGSDWDILVVSDSLTAVQINQVITKLEKKAHAQINVKLFTSPGFKELISEKTPFVTEVQKNSYVLKGDLHGY